MRTGVYVTWRRESDGPRDRVGDDCARVGPRSRCFCGCPFAKHKPVALRGVAVAVAAAAGCSSSSSGGGPGACTACTCDAFAFIPQRPEEVIKCGVVIVVGKVGAL